MYKEVEITDLTLWYGYKEASAGKIRRIFERKWMDIGEGLGRKRVSHSEGC